MTLPVTGSQAVYLGSGSTGPFTLENGDSDPILFANNSEIGIRKYDVDEPGGEIDGGTALVLNVDYTLTGAGSGSAGSITLTEALETGEMLTVVRNTPRTQTLDLAFGGDLSLEQLEATLDKLVRQNQDLRDYIDQAIIFSNTETDHIATVARFFPAPEASKYIGWNSAGTTLETKDQPHSFLSGSGAPADSLGENDDFYVDYTNSVIYGPKTGGSWGAGVSLIGATGPAGPTGPTGPTGPAGDGSGDVVGPSGATDHALVRFDETTGKLLQNSVALLSDAGVLSGLTGIGISGSAPLIDFTDTDTGADARISANTTNGGLIFSTDINNEASNSSYTFYLDGSTIPEIQITDGFLVPGVSAVMSLGSGSLGWAHAHLSAGGIINFNNGDILLVHSTNDLSFQGGTFTFPNEGMRLLDLGGDNAIILKPSTDLTANRTLSLDMSDANQTLTPSNVNDVGIPVIIDGGGTTITTGVKAYVPAPFAGTITRVDLLGDQTGSIIVDIWKDTYANYPPTNADSITSATPPTISSSNKSTNTTLSGWTTSVAKGDVFGINVDGCTTIQRATLMIYMRKS